MFPLELQTKVREDFTITEKVPTVAFSWFHIWDNIWYQSTVGYLLIGVFNQEKTLVGALPVIVKTKPIDRLQL